MSVLTNPQGLPDRVWSLVAGLEAVGGAADRASLDRLLNPGFQRDGMFVQAKAELAGNTLGAATSLGLIAADREEARLGEGLALGSPSAFADTVHDRLVSLEPGESDRVLLEAFAWVGAESDRQGDLAWLYEWGRDEFVDQLNAGLIGEDQDSKPMNTTRAPAWRRWLALLGLGVPLPLPTVPDFPSPAARIAREIERSSLKVGEEVPADQFLQLLAERMPYLDGGKLFIEACQRIGHRPKRRRLSPLLSAALRDLHDGGAIKMRPRGDAADAVSLVPDPEHIIQTFNMVLIGPSQEEQA